MKHVDLEDMKKGMDSGADTAQQVCNAMRNMKGVTPSFLVGFVTCVSAGLLGMVRARCGADGVKFVVDQLEKVRDTGNELVEAMECKQSKKGLH